MATRELEVALRWDDGVPVLDLIGDIDAGAEDALAARVGRGRGRRPRADPGLLADAATSTAPGSP